MTMAKKGAALEQLVALIQDTLKDRQDVSIKTNEKMADSSGIKREIDVLVTSKMQGVTMNIAFECKDYSKKAVDIQVVDAFVGKCKHLPQIHKKVIVSTSGFTANAAERANQEDIMLCPLENIPFGKILSNYNIHKTIPDFKVGDNINISFDEPVCDDFDSSCDCFLTKDDTKVDFIKETYRSLSRLETQVELAYNFMALGKKPFIATSSFKIQNGKIYIKSKNGRKYNICEAKIPVFVNFKIVEGRICSQQKMVQGNDVLITENTFEHDDRLISTVLIESGEKHNLLIRQGDAIVKPSISIKGETKLDI